MWTRENLTQLIKDKLGDYLFIVISNREPYVHVFKRGKIECQRGVGGVIAALDPVMQACHGLWIAYASGDADYKVVDKDDRIKVPPENPSYVLKRIWLTKEEETGYYLGYSNEALWPLNHMVFERPVFRKSDWGYYKSVNEKFAHAVVKEIGGQKAFIWIQDYHFCLLPKMLKELAPDQLKIAHFWHIPWLGYESFRICPQKKEILEGLLASDLLGFHLKNHCDSFLDIASREVESKIDQERLSITHAEHETIVRPYPISVDFETISMISDSKEIEEYGLSFEEEYGLSGLKVLFSLDRIDYTKGIPEKFSAVDRLLDDYPELKEKIIFVQMGEPSRMHIQRYKDLNDELNALAEKINWKHSTRNWRPIIFMRNHLSLKEAIAFYRLSDACIVGSLHDGMNLVAKEYVASCPPDKGMLVLSQFTGASKELSDALLANPFDREQFSKAILAAIMMPQEERRKRMDKMKAIVRQDNIFRWAGKMLSELLKIEFKE